MAVLSLSIAMYPNAESANFSVEYTSSVQDISYIDVIFTTTSVNIELYDKDGYAQIFQVLAPKDTFIPKIDETDTPNNNKLRKRYPIFSHNSYSNQVNFRCTFSMGVIANNVINRSEELNVKDFIRENIHVNEPYIIRCTNCKHVLTLNHFTFNKIEDYHSPEFSENWFCHASEEICNDNAASRTLYVDNFHFYILQGAVQHIAIVKEDFEYKCSYCLNMVAACDTSSNLKCLKFPLTKLYFSSNCDQYDDDYLSKVSMLSLLTQIRESKKRGRDCRLYFQCIEKNKSDCLLLWLEPKEVLQFDFKAEVVKFPSTILLDMDLMYKVLFYSGPSSFDLAKKWRHDFAVDFFVISSESMSVIHNHLKEMNFPNNTTKDLFLGLSPSLIKISKN